MAGMGETEGMGPSTCPNGLEIAPGFLLAQGTWGCLPVGQEQAPPPPSFRMKDTTAPTPPPPKSERSSAGAVCRPLPIKRYPTGQMVSRVRF